MGIPTTGVSQLFFGVVLAHLIASTLVMILLGVSCFYEAKAEGFGGEEEIPGNLREYRRSWWEWGSLWVLQIIRTVGLHGAVIATYNQEGSQVPVRSVFLAVPMFRQQVVLTNCMPRHGYGGSLEGCSLPWEAPEHKSLPLLAHISWDCSRRALNNGFFLWTAWHL